MQSTTNSSKVSPIHKSPPTIKSKTDKDQIQVKENSKFFLQIAQKSDENNNSGQNSKNEIREQTHSKMVLNIEEQKSVTNTINWSETPLYQYYNSNQSIIDVNKFQQIGLNPQDGFLAWDTIYYTNWEIETLLDTIKSKYNSFEKQEVHAQIYYKALITLKYLFDEQLIELEKFKRIKILYGKTNLENALKLLIRCKILYSQRMSLIDLFDTISRFTFSENLIIEFANQYNDHNNNKQEDQLSSLLNQFISVAEELAAKIHIIQYHSLHKNLQKKPFYFGGDQVDYQTISNRIYQVKKFIQQRLGNPLFFQQLNELWEIKEQQIIVKHALQKRELQIKKVYDENKMNVLGHNIHNERNKRRNYINQNERNKIESSMNENDNYQNSIHQKQIQNKQVNENLPKINQDIQSFQTLQTESQRQQQPSQTSSFRIRQNSNNNYSFAQPNQSVKKYSDNSESQSTLKLNIKNLNQKQIEKLMQMKIITLQQGFEAIQILKNGNINKSQNEQYNNDAMNQIQGPDNNYQKYENDVHILRQQNELQKNGNKSVSAQRTHQNYRMKYVPQIGKRNIEMSRTINVDKDMKINDKKKQVLRQLKNSYYENASSIKKNVYSPRDLLTRDTLRTANGTGRLYFGSQRKQTIDLNSSNQKNILSFKNQNNNYTSLNQQKNFSQIDQNRFNSNNTSKIKNQRPETQGNTFFQRLISRNSYQINTNIQNQNIDFRERLKTSHRQRLQVHNNLAIKTNIDNFTENVEKLKSFKQIAENNQYQNFNELIENQIIRTEDTPCQQLDLKIILENQMENKLGQVQTYGDLNDNKIDQIIDLAEAKDIQPQYLININQKRKFNLQKFQFEQESIKAQEFNNQPKIVKKKKQTIDPNHTFDSCKVDNKNSVNQNKIQSKQFTSLNSPSISKQLKKIEIFDNQFQKDLISQNNYQQQNSKLKDEKYQFQNKAQLFKHKSEYKGKNRSQSFEQYKQEKLQKLIEKHNKIMLKLQSQLQKRSNSQEIPRKQNKSYKICDNINRQVGKSFDSYKKSLHLTRKQYFLKQIFLIIKKLFQNDTKIPQKYDEKLKKLSDYMSQEIKMYKNYVDYQKFNQSNYQVVQKLNQNNIQINLSFSDNKNFSPILTERQMIDTQNSQQVNMEQNYDKQKNYQINTARDRTDNKMNPEIKIQDTNRTFDREQENQNNKNKFNDILNIQRESVSRNQINLFTYESVSAIDSLFQNNQHSLDFNSVYADNFQNKPQIINRLNYLDTGIQSIKAKKDRESQGLIFQLDRLISKYDNIILKEQKENLFKYYNQLFGIKIPNKNKMILPIEQLRGNLQEQAKTITLNRAATKIQQWFKKILIKRRVIERKNKIIWAKIKISDFLIYWKLNIKEPRKRKAQEEKQVFLIQKFLRGYQARRKCLKLLMEFRSNRIYEYYQRVERNMRSNLQRKIRKAWMRYKIMKALREKLRAELEAASKKGKRGYIKSQSKTPNLLNSLKQITPQKLPNESQSPPNPQRTQTGQAFKQPAQQQQQQKVSVFQKQQTFNTKEQLNQQSQQYQSNNEIIKDMQSPLDIDKNSVSRSENSAGEEENEERSQMEDDERNKRTDASLQKILEQEDEVHSTVFSQQNLKNEEYSDDLNRDTIQDSTLFTTS